MADLNHTYGTDLFVDDCGDISYCSGTTEVAQRLARRFLTNPATFTPTGAVAIPPDYIFEPNYGGGAGKYVDNLASPTLVAAIQTRFLDQCVEEPMVASSPAPIITVGLITGGITVSATVSLASGGVAAIPQLQIVN